MRSLILKLTLLSLPLTSTQVWGEEIDEKKEKKIKEENVEKDKEKQTEKEKEKEKEEKKPSDEKKPPADCDEEYTKVDYEIAVMTTFPRYPFPLPRYWLIPPLISSLTGEIFTRFDLLYFRAKEGSLVHAIPSEAFILGEGVDTNLISHFKDTSEWTPGFRVGIGCQFTDTAWQLSTEWMSLYFQSKWSQSKCEKSHWGTHLDVIDVQTGYILQPLPYLNIKPFCGVKVADINQNITARSIPELSVYTAIRGRNKLDFIGVGPSIGIEGVLALQYGFHLFANTSLSGLYGNFRNNIKVEGFDTVEWVAGTGKRHEKAWEGVFDLTCGLRWYYAFGSDIITHLALDVAAEYHCFRKQNRFITATTNAREHGNLDVYGLTTGVKLIF